MTQPHVVTYQCWRKRFWCVWSYWSSISPFKFSKKIAGPRALHRTWGFLNAKQELWSLNVDVWSHCNNYWFLGAFAKLRKATITFVMSVCPSVRMEYLGSHWTDFHWIWYLSIFRKSLERIQVLLKSDRNDGCFTRSLLYSFEYIPLISS